LCLDFKTKEIERRKEREKERKKGEIKENGNKRKKLYKFLSKAAQPSFPLLHA
jgi:hypothetical protein